MYVLKATNAVAKLGILTMTTSKTTILQTTTRMKEYRSESGTSNSIPTGTATMTMQNSPTAVPAILFRKVPKVWRMYLCSPRDSFPWRNSFMNNFYQKGLSSGCPDR